MSMSIKKSRLFKLLAVAALVVVMAIGTALPSFASSEDKKLYFQTTGNAYEVWQALYPRTFPKRYKLQLWEI